ncbi:EVE domain-containing protein [Limnochorda pilosa]|uniref:Ubiquinol-cytochrome C reductase n=1 Tax=Limnochorda pilosa TaxID=1555112 RepID=A0A0K2SGF7_LIMPI|nr:EVE domain-containing protein [Limnochorda pilosa]BAS26183.1 ubiquinol-cytochrome C reductase [Limnochorda pilosa]
MAYWLLKTEPGEYSYANLEAAGRDVWDGVRNAVALRYLRAMQPGDQALVYHSGKERAVVGVAQVATEPHPDPRTSDPRWTVVDVEPRGRLARPVGLAEIKADRAFQDWELVRLPRLSVMPVEPALWERILRMGGGVVR